MWSSICEAGSLSVSGIRAAQIRPKPACGITNAYVRGATADASVRFFASRGEPCQGYVIHLTITAGSGNRNSPSRDGWREGATDKLKV